ncbi:carnitine acetyltransferase [Marasmius fiardii PR-910]|nr:carnitine acetyltransferase [Marasmius fiardii PR-910]
MQPVVHIRCNSAASGTQSASATTARPILPRLPVPDLRKTLDKYLKSLEPFLLEDAIREGINFKDAFALRAKWADDFFIGIGKNCQERLIELDRQSPNNWLDDNFWLETYLGWRAPLIINSNWWLAFHDDDEYTPPPVTGTSHTDWQKKRAAWLVHRTLEFKDKQEVYTNATRTGIWLQENIARMFNRARIPKHNCDILSPITSLSDPSAQSITVVVNNWFYSLRVYELQSTMNHPIPCHPEVIFNRLHAIVDDARTRPGIAPPVGVLSSENRDTWASNLEHLFSLSQKNRDTHRAIVNSVMCLSLDSETYSVPSNSSSTLRPPSGTAQQTLDSHLCSIRSVPTNIANRFFDKPYTLILDPSGRAGAMGEHSFCDALVPSIVAEYSIVQGVGQNFTASPPQNLPSSDSGWARLDWEIDDRIASACEEARANALRLIENSDDSVLWFERYGSDWMKGQGMCKKLSPDAYIQMALQLAWYRTRGFFTATYETALTRMFNKGRTETIRTFSTDSRAFVIAMDDPHTNRDSKYAFLKRAIQTHTRLTREAATGRGIDRHLFGLQKMLHGNEHTELFDDPLFSRSQEWKLSTSGLSAGHLFRGTGFGAAYEDGYGINYLAAPEMVKFGIESKHSNPHTSTEGFKIAIVNAMKDMESICPANLRASSKL